MIRLAKIEFRKLFNSSTFWWLLGLHFFFYALISYFVEKVLSIEISSNENTKGLPLDTILSEIDTFPDVWLNIGFVGGIFKIFLAILVIIGITNEYHFRTIRQNLIDGMSRLEFVISKGTSILFLSLVASLFLLLLGGLLGFLNTENLETEYIFEKIGFVAAYGVEVFAFLCLAFMIGNWVKKSGLAIGLFLLYYAIVENILQFIIGRYISESVASLMPLEVIGGLVPSSLGAHISRDFIGYPNWPMVGLAFVYGLGFMAVSYFVLQKRDL